MAVFPPVPMGLILPPGAPHGVPAGPAAHYLARLAARRVRVAAFSVRDVRLREGLVQALLYGPGGTQSGLVPLPPLIDNRAVHRRRENVRALRALAEHPGVTVLNQANRYDLELVLDVLAAAPEPAAYLAPRLDPQRLPETLGGAGAVLLLRPGSGRAWLLLRRGGRLALVPLSPLGHRPDPPPVVTAGAGLATRGRLVALEVSDCLPPGGGLRPVRVAAQRGPAGDWTVLGTHGAGGSPAAAVNALGRQLARFLPALAAAEFDFLLTAAGGLRPVGLWGLAFNAAGAGRWGAAVWERSADLSLDLVAAGVPAAARPAGAGGTP